MSVQQFHRKAISDRRIKEVAADALSKIKHEDELTFPDLKRVLGKSEDQIAKYLDGTAEMKLCAVIHAAERWNGRFMGPLLDLITEARGGQCPFQAQTSIIGCAHALSVALEDGRLTDQEIRENRAAIEAARDALTGLLDQIKPRTVA